MINMKKIIFTFIAMLSENSYDTIAATTSNATRVTADMDSTNLTLSIGKNF